MNISEICHQFHQQEINFLQLLRKILSYDQWCLPYSNSQPLLIQNDGSNLLLLFSSQELFIKHNGTDLEFKLTKGTWLGDRLNENIDSLLIDPNESHGVQLPKEYFYYLKKISQACLVEELLEGNDNEKNAISILQDYEHFLVPIIQDEDGTTHITLAPDDQGRKFAAVFTAEDCLQSFIEASKELLGEELKINEIRGKELFANLNHLDLEGVAFNCYGPVSPRVLSKDFIKIIAEALH
jgi:hypothetical protein